MSISNLKDLRIRNRMISFKLLNFMITKNLLTIILRTFIYSLQTFSYRNLILSRITTSHPTTVFKV